MGGTCGLPNGPDGPNCGECKDGLKCLPAMSPAPASCGICKDTTTPKMPGLRKGMS